MVDNLVGRRILRACPLCHVEAAHVPPPVLTHYVIVRADLPLGVLAAQVTHAAGESSPGGLSSGTNAVVLAVPDEVRLRALAEKLARAGIQRVLVEEPDAPWNGALMAIGCVPTKKEVVQRHVSSLPLLR